MTFVVPVPVMQRPGAVCLAVPGPDDVELRPDGLVLEIWPLLEERDDDSLGDIPDANLVLDVLGNQAYAVSVEMGFGSCPDGVWNGHWDSGIPSLALIGQG